MATARRRLLRALLSLLLAIVFFGLAATALIVLNPINTRHVTVAQPTPGQVTLPPTATPRSGKATATPAATATTSTSP